MFHQYSKLKNVVQKNCKIHRSIKQFLLLSLTIFLVCACAGNVTKNKEGQINFSSRSPCHTMEHALGKTCVPNAPQRVVVLDILDNVLALGITPVGATTWDNGKFRTYLPEKTTAIAKVGLLSQPNLESILSLHPDLILSVYWGDEETYERLSQIAPTVLAGNGKDIDWQEWLKTYAEALGKTQEAQKLLSDYNTRIAAFREQMGEKLSKTQVSIVMFWENVRIYMNQSFSGQILNDVGLPRPPGQDKEKVNVDVSLELIPQMDGDAIFLVLGDRTPKLAQFTSHPLWSQLQAVKQGKVYEVEADAWIAGYSPVAANRILDDLFKYLVGEIQK